MMPVVILWVCIGMIVAQTLLELNFERLDRSYARRTRNAVPENLKDRVSPEEHSRSADYAIEHSNLSSWETVCARAIKIAFILSGAIPLLYNATNSAFAGNLWMLALMIEGVSIGLGVLLWPFDWASTFGIEAKYGFNKTTPALWWRDLARSLVLGIIFSVPIYVLIFYFAETLPLWWVWAFVVLTVYELILTWLWPNFISPLFNKFTPLPEGSLKDRLMALVDRAGIKVKKILVMDASKRSGHSNAYFTGFGSSRRIVLYDTIIEQMEETELEAVLAHEIGHMKKKHILKSLLWSSAVSIVGLWVLSLVLAWPDFYRAFGLDISSGVVGGFWLVSFVAGAFMLWMIPLSAAYSRKHEYEADAISAELVGSPTPLITGLRKMKKENLSSVESHPATHAFYAGHPTVLERERALLKK